MEQLENVESTIAVEESTDASGNPVFQLVGEIDISNVEHVQSLLEPAVNRDISKLIFDFSGLTFIDSSGIAALLWAAERCPAVEIQHASSIVRRIISSLGLTDILQVKDD